MAKKAMPKDDASGAHFNWQYLIDKMKPVELARRDDRLILKMLNEYPGCSWELRVTDESGEVVEHLVFEAGKAVAA